MLMYETDENESLLDDADQIGIRQANPRTFAIAEFALENLMLNMVKPSDEVAEVMDLAEGLLMGHIRIH